MDAHFVQSTRTDIAASRAAIDSAWARMSADPDLHLFDGPMCRLESFQEQRTAGGPRLRLDLSLTSYRIFLGTNLHGPPDLSREAMANPVGVSPALETRDGFLLFGRRNARVAYYPHRLHPFSGSLEPPADGRPLDIFAECRRELAEELSVTADQVPQIVLLGIVEDEQIRHPELILHARTTLARRDFESRLNAAEHVALHAVPADPAGVATALAEASFTPVARAALTLFARAPAAVVVAPDQRWRR